ncbi:fatty acyl-AMP ligase [Legionella nagasakiensis]|uniref:fatty acyl-AMP ligase n=1 Tax=Legionella nagasakiensis TaxID=535290 RepID=UPI00105578D2|nr:fatty acyl-AMP ligase [Legionella nagasakiensis]
MTLEFQSFVDVLSHRVQKTPKQMACLFLNKNDGSDSSQLTYEELDSKARAIAAALQEQNIKKGDRALLIFVPGLDLISAFFGCLYAGVIAVPVYPPINKKLMDKIRRIIENAAPKIMLMTEEHLKKYGRLEEKNRAIISSHSRRELLLPLQFERLSCLTIESIPAHSSNRWQQPEISSKHLAFLQYTSGSTSYPKGVMISHGNLLDNLSKICQAFDMNKQSILFGWLPPYHDMGLIGNILSPIYGGFPGILMTPFSFLQNPFSWLQNISKYRVTISGSPNFAYDYCVRRIKDEKKQDLDLSSWKVAFNGAEPVHAETMERFYQAFKEYGFRKETFYPCYGLAEATLLVAGGMAGESYHTVNVAKQCFQDHRIHFVDDMVGYTLVSCGKMRHDVKIVDPDTHQECPADMVGEIWLKSPSVAHGYWQQEEETKQAFHGTIHHKKNKSSFLRTGDLGFIHNNELYVTGRIKDLIILYGKNHYPQDIEYTILHSSLYKQIGSCAAFVKAVNNEYRLTVMCEIKNRYLEQSAQNALFNALFELIYQEHQLEVHKIVLVPNKTIPKTTSGKISRNFCRQQLINKSIPIIATWYLIDNDSSQET